MPELPDLENIVGFLNSSLPGLAVESVEVRQPLVIRQPAISSFGDALKGKVFLPLRRRGKFLLLPFTSRDVLAINPMLTGRLQYCAPGEKAPMRVCFLLSLSNGMQLRYLDRNLMGKVYLLPEEDLRKIPRFSEMAPEALGPEVTLELFQKRLKRHPGMIKNILVNDRFLAGIGNAYADEILFEAGIHPYRARPRLSAQEIAGLYSAMHKVLTEATEEVGSRMGGQIHVKFRGFLQVHGKGGQPCPRCGSTISQITANQRLTNFCRHCQK